MSSATEALDSAPAVTPPKSFWGRSRRAGWALTFFTVVALCIAVGQLPGDTILVEVEDDIPWTIATHLNEGRGYTACNTSYFPFCRRGNDQTAMREPVPVLVFLAAMRLYPSPFAGVLLDIALYVGIMHFLYFSSRKEGCLYALLAAFFWLTSVPVAQEIGSGSGQLVAAGLLALGLFCFQTGRTSGALSTWALAGLLLGLAALSRTIILYLSVGLALGLLFDVTAGSLRSRLRQAGTLLVVLGLVMTPWAARNQMVFGSPIVGSTLSGYNLFRHNLIVAQEDFRPHYVGSREARAAVKSLLASTDHTGDENEHQMQTLYSHEGVRLILAHPIEYVQLVGFRFFVLWFNISMKAAYGDALDVWDYVLAAEHLILLLAACAGALLRRRQLWPQALGLTLACAAYMAVGAQARYLVELMPMVAVLAAGPLMTRDTATTRPTDAGIAQRVRAVR